MSFFVCTFSLFDSACFPQSVVYLDPALITYTSAHIPGFAIDSSPPVLFWPLPSTCYMALNMLYTNHLFINWWSNMVYIMWILLDVFVFLQLIDVLIFIMHLFLSPVVRWNSSDGRHWRGQTGVGCQQWAEDGKGENCSTGSIYLVWSFNHESAEHLLCFSIS